MERITIIGLGLIGGSIALGLKQAPVKDIEIAGIARAAEVDRMSFEEKLALARRVEAREDLHQRRFAGAVVAHHAHHFVLVEREIDAAQRRDGAEILDDPARFEVRVS